MAEAITIACPECEKKITVAADAVGKKIRCKGCEHVFVIQSPAIKKADGKPGAKAAPAKAAAPKPAAKAPAPKKAPDAKFDKSKPDKPKPKTDDEEEENSNPYGVTSLDTAPRCPNCANEIESEDDVICLTCGYNMRTRELIAAKSVEDDTGMVWFLWLLPGILSALAVLALIGFDFWYCLAIDSLVADEWYFFIAHQSIKIWLVIISLFFMAAFVRFAVQRLILHPRPPERVKKKGAKDDEEDED